MKSGVYEINTYSSTLLCCEKISCKIPGIKEIYSIKNPYFGFNTALNTLGL